MFSYIKGEVVKTYKGTAILECNGIGYEFTVTDFTVSELNRSKTAMLFAYLQVRDDGITLYGFRDEEEKSMFLRLITVTGIGPKAAMGILSSIALPALATAIITKDLKALSKAKGVGKKTAERLVLELRESMEKDFKGEDSLVDDVISAESGDEADAVLALRTLGIGRHEAVNAVKKAAFASANIEELIANALKYL